MRAGVVELSVLRDEKWMQGATVELSPFPTEGFSLV